jgi:hypothetical protein
MRTIVEINPGERLAVVQPGVVNDDLRAAAAAHNLWYPPDPVQRLVVDDRRQRRHERRRPVLREIRGHTRLRAGAGSCHSDREVVRLGRRTANGVAGYDLVGVSAGVSACAMIPAPDDPEQAAAAGRRHARRRTLHTDWRWGDRNGPRSGPSQCGSVPGRAGAAEDPCDGRRLVSADAA